MTEGSNRGDCGSDGSKSDPSHPRSILERWDISAASLTRLVDENPSLRGMLLGYVAEYKLSELLAANADISSSMKYDDHDRTNKGDRVVEYKGNRFVVESKSLQTNTVREKDGIWIGKAQVDASDRRTVTFADGSRLDTTLLLFGDFDVLAVNCFAFKNEWRWLFCKNADLSCSRFRRYTPEQQQHLIASLVVVSWPPRPPFTENIFDVLEDLIRLRGAAGGSISPSA